MTTSTKLPKTSKSTSPFKRSILAAAAQKEASHVLQQTLVTLVDLALLLKQAHWNVIGPNFHPLHLQLDEIIESVRNASDETAERMSMLGVSPDGRASTVAGASPLEDYPEGFLKVEGTITQVADALKQTIDGLRDAIEKLDDLDLVSQDLMIAISSTLEKHLWMVQAQEC